MNLPKHITDERTGLKYELIGDYYFIAGDDDEPKDNRPIITQGTVLCVDKLKRK